MGWVQRGQLLGGGGGGDTPDDVALPVSVAIPPTPKTSRWHAYPGFGSITTSSVLGSTLYAVPVAIQKVPSISAVSVNIYVTTASAGQSLRAAIYAMDDGLEPAALLQNLGTIGADTVGSKSFPTAPVFSAVGWYAIVVTSVGGNTPCRFVSSAQGSLTPALTAPNGTAHAGLGFIRGSTTLGAAGAWPATFAATGTAVTMPRIDVRF